GEVFGAQVTHSPVLMHGKTSVITHDGEGLFFGCPNPLTVTRYHSLAIVDETLDLEKFEVTARTEDGIVMAIEHRERPLFGEICGAQVTHSPVLMHGKTSVITHDGEGLFFGCPNPLTVTRYHSLAIVDETLDLEKFEVTARTEDGIVMAIEHRERPLFGVQFHPESVLTECGYLMLGNWLEVCGLEGAAVSAA